MTLFAAGAIVTIAGSLLLSSPRLNNHIVANVFYVIGWPIIAIGIWILLAAAEAYIPLWVPISLGILAVIAIRQALKQFTAAFYINGSTLVLITLLLILFSTTEINRPMALTVIAISILAIWVAPYMHPFIPFANWAAIGSTVIAAGILLGPSGFRSLTRFDSMGRLGDTIVSSQLLSLGLLPAQYGQKVELSNGSVAWFSQPRGDSSRPAAIIFHGNDADGSQQPAAIIMQRALINSGYAVLALDHTSYGASIPPPMEGPVDLWDPQLGRLAAYDWLAAQPNVSEIYLVGHSMGNDELWKVTAARPDVAGLFWFGAQIASRQSYFSESEVDWGDWEDYYQRFHDKRQLDSQLDRDLFLTINSLYYGTAIELKQPDIASHFVMFNTEWDNIVDSRDQLYAEIPEPKSRQTLNANHYFSSTEWRGILAGDTRVMNDLTQLFTEQRD